MHSSSPSLKLYNCLMASALPFVVTRHLFKGRSSPAYCHRFSERFGRPPFSDLSRSLWLHAVSVGESQAAVPLIQALIRTSPGSDLLVTTTTPTGSDLVTNRFGERVRHCYFPYDHSAFMRAFLKRADPRLAMFMETEIWPSCLQICRQRNIPAMLINARLSPHSYRGYRRIRFFIKPLVQSFRAILAQSRADAERFLDLGADPGAVFTTGNLKYEQRIPDTVRHGGRELRAALGAERPVWIAASTHEGEEELVLQAHAEIRRALPEALLMLVPRHPERFQAVAELCRKKGFAHSRRSEGSPARQADVYLGDTMGELLLLYAAADAAFVGGSLVPTGGHNMLEPAAIGLPVLTGPHIENFSEIGGLLSANGALEQVSDSAALARGILALLRHPNQGRAQGRRGEATVAANTGALAATLEHIEAALQESGAERRPTPRGEAHA